MEAFEKDAAGFDVEMECSELCRWFQTLPLSTLTETVEDLLDGEAFLEALKVIDESFFSIVGSPSAGEDKRFLFVDLQTSMTDYIIRRLRNDGTATSNDFGNVLQRISTDVAHGGTSAIARLLQLILVCAVLCPDKQVYINNMRTLESEVTVAISKAILQIIPVQDDSETTGSVPCLVPSEVNSSATEKEWCHNCVALQNEVVGLNTVRNRLLQINIKMKADLDRAQDADSEGSPASKRIAFLLKESNALKEFVAKLEAAKDEYRIKCAETQDQLTNAIVEAEQLKRRVADLDRLRDELLEWKHTAATLSKYENEVKVYRKKMDEVGDLRQQLKVVEGRNTELMKRNIELEQENAQLSVVAASLDCQRKEIDVYEQELKLATKRLQGAEAEIRDLQGQTVNLERLNKSLQTEHFVSRQDSQETLMIPLESSLSYELLPPSVKEDMLKLQLENADLKKQLMEKSNPTVLAFSEGFAADAKHMLVNGGFGPEEETEQRHMIRRHERQDDGDHSAVRLDSVLVQRDSLIRTLEDEVEFLRRHYGNQQKLITAAWYRQGLKMEQQAAHYRLQGMPSDDVAGFQQRSNFLDEQRRTVGPPVNTSLFAQKPIISNQATLTRAPSKSFMGR